MRLGFKIARAVEENIKNLFDVRHFVPTQILPQIKIEVSIKGRLVQKYQSCGERNPVKDGPKLQEEDRTWQDIKSIYLPYDQ
eukprot:scaffold893_cov143-Skeletonema_marinoi.AAC.2